MIICTITTEKSCKNRQTSWCKKTFTFFTIPEDAKKFYENILKIADENIEDVIYYDEDCY